MSSRSLLIALAFVACTAPAATEPIATLDGDLEPLRAAFDAAHGKVRAVFLVSPT